MTPTRPAFGRQRRFTSSRPAWVTYLKASLTKGGGGGGDKRQGEVIRHKEPFFMISKKQSQIYRYVLFSLVTLDYKEMETTSAGQKGEEEGGRASARYVR